MKFNLRLFAILFISVLGFANTNVFAQTKSLTNDQYFKNDFKGIISPLPRVGSWVDDNSFLLIKNGSSFIVNAKNGTQQPYEEKSDASKKVEDKNVQLKSNNIFYANQQLTFDDNVKVNPTASPDGKFVAYTQNNDLYTVSTETKKITRLTTDGTELIKNGYASWVYMEEILGRASRYRSFWWSPDSKNIAFFRSDDTEVPEFIITDGTGLHGYVEKTKYPKVADKNPEVKVGIVSPNGGNISWADFNEKTDQYFGMPFWKPDGKSLLVQWMNRNQDSLIVYEVNPANGTKKNFYTEVQKNSWINLDDLERFDFLENGKNIIIQSDATGWNHLYLYDINGKLINPITSGKYTVLSVDQVDEKNKQIFFTARGRENTARKDLYRVGFNGKGLQSLTSGDYSNTLMSISPNGDYVIARSENSSSPARLVLLDKKGKQISELGNSAGTDFKDYVFAKTEIQRVKSDDGLFDLPMKITWPTNMQPGKKYPVLISIYGGPNAGTVWDTYSMSGNQQFYAKEGLIQVAMDHRASGQFGKAGVNYMYHNLGDWELKDYATMVNWLIKNGQADPEKICITGFSYGGYMTCLALTKYANVFTHGMAGGAVTDWRLYDSHYTERFMGRPSNNPEGYKTSSPFTYIDQFKGKLQLVHGVIDDNVHLQNSLQFAAALQDQGKDFEEMFYSEGRHGWGNLPKRNAHFQNLKTKFIYKYLLEKDVPKEMLR